MTNTQKPDYVFYARGRAISGTRSTRSPAISWLSRDRRTLSCQTIALKDASCVSSLQYLSLGLVSRLHRDLCHTSNGRGVFLILGIHSHSTGTHSHEVPTELGVSRCQRTCAHHLDLNMVLNEADYCRSKYRSQ